MTTVNYFNCPYVIKKFDKHDELKNDVLDCINNQSSFKIKSDTTNIRSDWGSYKNTSKKYWSILEKDINLYLKNIFCDILGYSDFIVGNYWYQQYTKDGSHGWHTHLHTMWTSVYYLEMPDDAPKTQCIDPLTKNVIDIDASEGDILTFPSLIIHRAPLVTSDCRKTILSWHCESSYNISY